MFAKLLITLEMFSLHIVALLVVTKYQTDTVTKYFNHIRNCNGDEALEWFLKKNLTESCHTLRQSNVFQSVPLNTNETLGWGRSSIMRFIPGNNFKIEQNQVGIRMRKFKVENSNQTLSFHSFQCLNLEGEPMWFITPAFIPHSAFLFAVEPRFHHLVAREINGKTDIPTRLIAIVDEGVTEVIVPDVMDNVFDKSIKAKNFNQRDELCDLNSILQHRLCVTVAAEARRNELHLYYTDTPTYKVYEDRSINFYYRPDDHEGSCKPAVLSVETEPGQWNAYSYKMLYCSVLVSGIRPIPFYLSLNGRNPLEVIYLRQHWHSRSGPNSWNNYIDIYKVPLLKHLKKYEEALKNIDV